MYLIKQCLLSVVLFMAFAILPLSMSNLYGSPTTNSNTLVADHHHGGNWGGNWGHRGDWGRGGFYSRPYYYSSYGYSYPSYYYDYGYPNYYYYNSSPYYYYNDPNYYYYDSGLSVSVPSPFFFLNW
jgi:hypothetical protein